MNSTEKEDFIKFTPNIDLLKICFPESSEGMYIVLPKIISKYKYSRITDLLTKLKIFQEQFVTDMCTIVNFIECDKPYALAGKTMVKGWFDIQFDLVDIYNFLQENEIQEIKILGRNKTNKISSSMKVTNDYVIKFTQEILMSAFENYNPDLSKINIDEWDSHKDMFLRTGNDIFIKHLGFVLTHMKKQIRKRGGPPSGLQSIKEEAKEAIEIYIHSKELLDKLKNEKKNHIIGILLSVSGLLACEEEYYKDIDHKSYHSYNDYLNKMVNSIDYVLKKRKNTIM